ncbi:hypothetical protein SK128_002970, partial [Halocaridina rubra]
TNLALSVCPSGNLYKPWYSYRSPSFLRRSTDVPQQYSSSLKQPRNNYNESVQLRSLTSTSSPSLETLSPQPKQSEDNNFSPVETDAASNRGKLPFTSPIHSLLDIFGFNTTNTSTITSRLLPREPEYYDEDIDYVDLYDANPKPEAQNRGSTSEGEDNFVPTHISRRLPLLLETSVSISLQDYEEDESQNSGDIPRKPLDYDNTEEHPGHISSSFENLVSFKELNFPLLPLAEESHLNPVSVKNTPDSHISHSISGGSRNHTNNFPTSGYPYQQSNSATTKNSHNANDPLSERISSLS